MCGIAGIIDLRGGRDIDPALLSKMNEAQHHRGPDEGGIHVEPGVGLAHRRLSIIDLSSGQQPLFNEDGSVVVVYNGEIYNFQDLTKELIEKGHVFKTHCDTEVIVHAWEQWGESCVNKFRGMFAFALWDRNKQTLFLARDRLGIKPLYYAHLENGEFLFASELKALMLHPGLSRNIDSYAIEDYLTFGYVPEPRTIFKQANKLPPAHTLSLKIREPMSEPKEYWDISFEPVHFQSEDDIKHELIDRLKESVRIRLVSEVPLGAFLSGGVDSSAIVALMAQLMGKDPVNTCSIGFGDPKFNETEFADIVAKQYHTNHFMENVDPEDFDLLDELATLYDEPFADSSAIPTYRVCQLAKKRVTVTLSGDGGDECFAGYRRHRWHMNEERIRQWLPQGLRGPLFRMLGRIYPKMDRAPRIFRAKSTFQALARDSVAAYLHSVSVLYDDIRQPLYSKGFRRELQQYNSIEVFKRHISRAQTKHPLSMIQYLDFKTYLPGDILTKVDRASMAHALEVRVPILDHKFVEWVSGIPPQLSLKGQEGKYIFKRALEPYVPKDVMYRPKMGFAVPISRWFRGPLRDRVRKAVLGDVLAGTGIFDQNFLKKMVDEHQSGVREHSAALWSLLMFEAFLRKTGAGISL
jgi:asparagine synthase (glutamine-hydrolysing)